MNKVVRASDLAKLKPGRYHVAERFYLQVTPSALGSTATSSPAENGEGK